MTILRRTSLAVAGALVAAGLAAPAQADTEPTTLAVEGTLEVLVVDHFAHEGEGHGHSERVYTVVTDDGAEIPVELDDDAPADARFRGELVVAGAVASALDAKDLLPRAGSTIDEDTRAGRAAIAVAEDQATPLAVESSTVSPAAFAAAAAPSAHRAYMIRMTVAQTSIEGTDPVLTSAVNGMLNYWRAEPGAVTSFSAVAGQGGALPTFPAPSGVSVGNSCGMGLPNTYMPVIFDRAEQAFPDVDFDLPGNHLLVLTGNECGAGGIAGIAGLGSSIDDGGRSMVTFQPDLFNQVGAHELGHNFGLEHANLDTCPMASICEYYDFYSVMGLALGINGSSDPTVFNPPVLGTLYRSQLGLTAVGETGSIAAAPGQVTDQTFALSPRSQASGLRGLQVTDPTTGTPYSIDLRDGAGRDANTFYGLGYVFGTPAPLYPRGVVIERQAADGETYLMTSVVSGRASGTFAAGTAFAPSSGLRVTVNSIGASASVRVQLNAPAPAPAPAPRKFRTKTPKISGTARVGRTLKVTVGSWSPRPSYRYQWYANGKKITKKGAKASFTLTSRQKGKRITVKVTARKSGYTTITKTSKKTKKIAKRA